MRISYDDLRGVLAFLGILACIVIPMLLVGFISR